MSKLAIHVDNGRVSRIETDDERLGVLEVAVLIDNKPARLIRPSLDVAVGQYVEAVRSAELSHRLKEICGTIACLFDAASKSEFNDPQQMIVDINARLQQARDLLESAKKETGWQDERRMSVLRPIQQNDLIERAG